MKLTELKIMQLNGLESVIEMTTEEALTIADADHGDMRDELLVKTIRAACVEANTQGFGIVMFRVVEISKPTGKVAA